MIRPVNPASLSCKHPSGPQTLFYIPTFRADATSRRSRFILMQVSFGPQLLFLISRPVDPASLSCKYPFPTNLIFPTIFMSACHVPSTQVLSCKCPSVHKLYFSYQLFERMPRPVNPASFSCKCPLAHKPYFSYQLLERMPSPIDSGSFPCKRPLNSNHPVHCTFLI